jgi:HMG box factor, other
MSISIPDPSISWYRVLPKPPALLHEHFNDPFPRRNSSLLQHHITSDKSFGSVSDSIAGRRITVPSIAYSEIPRSSSRIDSPVRNSTISIGSTYTGDAPVSRKRSASLMEDGPRSRDPSPHSDEASNQFCLCQPDPKIPRPRNGTCSFPFICLCKRCTPNAAFAIKSFGKTMAL